MGQVATGRVSLTDASDLGDEFGSELFARGMLNSDQVFFQEWAYIVVRPLRQIVGP